MAQATADDHRQSQLEAAEKLFVATFGAPSDYAVAAPGRVNLIGEHTE